MIDSESENEDLDFLADSGSEYEPEYFSSSSDSSNYHCHSDSSSCHHSGTSFSTRKRKRQKLPLYNWHDSTSTGSTDYKPFKVFMSDVIFSLSGFVNPFRALLRSKAMEMGAHYRPDWDNTCTHLICAFRDTPKYNQVKGKGKIVKKEWIEDCYAARKRFPWRRYALDWRDGKGNESEDEIHEDYEIVNSYTPTDQSKDNPSSSNTSVPDNNPKRNAIDSNKT